MVALEKPSWAEYHPLPVVPGLLLKVLAELLVELEDVQVQVEEVLDVEIVAGSWCRWRCFLCSGRMLGLRHISSSVSFRSGPLSLQGFLIPGLVDVRTVPLGGKHT